MSGEYVVAPVDTAARDRAVRAAVRRFDGFEVREDWDPAQRIAATLEACGYEPLIETIFDAAHDYGTIVYADELAPEAPGKRRHTKNQLQMTIRRLAKKVQRRDVRNTIIAGQRDACRAEIDRRDAILRRLAERPEPIYDSMYCMLCGGEAVDYRSAAHAEDCAWRQARELHPEAG